MAFFFPERDTDLHFTYSGIYPLLKRACLITLDYVQYLHDG